MEKSIHEKGLRYLCQAARRDPKVMFDGYPDPYEIKADSHVVGVRPALHYENVTLKTHSPVARLENDRIQY